MVWKPTVLAPISRVLNFTSEWNQCSAEAEFSNKTKTDNMDLDNHLLASTMCGLVSDLNGASKFINDKPDPSQVTLTCNWTQKLWVERHENFQNLVDQNIAKVGNTQAKSEATHVVVSVFYGVQIFCVFAQDVKGKEEDEQVRKVTQEKLSKIMKKFQAAFDSQLNLENFKQEFNEEMHELADLKCRLYVDLKKESVNECNLFEAYQYCIDLKRNISKDGATDIDKLKGVPIAIQLCPLRVLLPPSTIVPDFRDVDAGRLNDCCRILADLTRIVIRAEKTYAAVTAEKTCKVVREFIQLVLNYQHFLQEDLKKAVVLARSNSTYSEDYYNYLFGYCEDDEDDKDDEIMSIVSKAENHPLFKTSRLEQWIDSKEAEMYMMEFIVTKVGTGVVVLADGSQLTEHINKKNVLVLTLPPLDERTNETLGAMKKSREKPFDDNFQSEETTNHENPWHLVQSKKRLVLTYLKEMVTHVKRNKEEQAKFIITFGESGNPFGCSYSVYQNGKLLKNNLLRLPSPPSGLRIVHQVTQKAKKAKTTFSSITVKWNYEDLGFPRNFTAHYRQKGTSGPWVSLMNKNTKSVQNQLDIDYPTGSQMEIRITANTCIGRSDFSAVIDTSVPEANSSPAIENDKIFLRPPTHLKVKLNTVFYYLFIYQFA